MARPTAELKAKAHLEDVWGLSWKKATSRAESSMGDRRAVLSAGSTESSCSSGMALVGPAGASAREAKAIGRSCVRAGSRLRFPDHQPGEATPGTSALLRLPRPRVGSKLTIWRES